MPDYKGMYLLLFNAMTDAEEYLMQGNYDLALAALMYAQMKTEELYMREGEDEIS